MRITSRDVRIDGAEGKDRVHSRASSVVHRKGGLDPSRHPESEDKH